MVAICGYGGQFSISVDKNLIYFCAHSLRQSGIFKMCVKHCLTNKPNTVPYRHCVLVENLRLFSLTGTIFVKKLFKDQGAKQLRLIMIILLSLLINN